MFYSLKKEIVGKSYTPLHIQRVISKHLKQHLPIKIKKCLDPKVEKGFIYTGGCYYSMPDRKGKTSIEVNFSYHPDQTNLKITEYRFKRMAVRFADVMLHEIIHMRQFRARNYKAIPGYQSTAEYAKDRKEQEYYGDRDEMGAFAFNIACEMVDRFGYIPAQIYKYMDSNEAKRHKNTWWHTYLKTFNWDHNHPIIRRMKSLVLYQLYNASVGKPFITNSYLTY
jgi:hypothetical protein